MAMFNGLKNGMEGWVNAWNPKFCMATYLGLVIFLMYIYGVSVVEGYELVYEIAFEVV